jgi:hypothetical protein
MKLRSILWAQSIRLIDISDFLSTVYLPDASKVVAEHYGFMQVPTFEQLNSPTGGMFQHGKFVIGSRTVRVDSLHIFSNALTAVNRTSTDDMDAFLDDFMGFVSEHLGARLDAPTARSYLSKVEIQANISFSRHLPMFVSVEKKITEAVLQYGFSDLHPTFQVNGFNISFDTSKLATTPFQPFIFEYRASKPFDANEFFSQAPLRTDAHLTILEQLEEILHS